MPTTPLSVRQPNPVTSTATTAGASSPVILSARGVRRTFEGAGAPVEALRGVDLDIRAGEFLVVMGPSGNGKSTLLNCLSGLDQIDDGSVTIDGHDLATMSDKARTAHRAERMGFVFQAFHLISVMSAVENVELPLLASGATRKEARGRAVSMLEQVGLSDRIGHRPAHLSGGEQQRVAVARALVAEPAIVWADEPTGNLDSETAANVLGLFLDAHRRGQTVVVVTHDPRIGALADRIVDVRDGQAHVRTEVAS